MTDGARERGLQIPLATLALIGVVGIGFAVGVTSGMVPVTPTPQQLVAAGASYGPRTLDGEWWRLASAAVVHAGWAHLVVNVVTMSVMGVALERRLGGVATVAVFVGASVVGTAAGTASAPYAVIVGASSGALGMASALVIAMAVSTVRRGPRTVEIVLLAIALAVIVGHVALGRGRDDIDQVGHVAGVIAGIAAAIVMSLFPKPFVLSAPPFVLSDAERSEAESKDAVARAAATAAAAAAAAATATAAATAAAAAAATAAAIIIVIVARPAPYEPRNATARLVAIEARFDQLVDGAEPGGARTTPRAELAAQLEREVVAPLEELASDRRLDDARMNAKLRARVARLKAYARARADVVTQFADAVRRDDVAPLAEIERASRAADAILDGPLP